MGYFMFNISHRLIAVSLVRSCAASYYLIIYRRDRQEFEDLTDGIDIRTDIRLLTSQLLWGGIAIGATLGIGKRVCVAATEINEFDVVVNTGQQDIVGLEVKM